MTGLEFKASLRALGMSQRAFALEAGVLPSSVTRWVKTDSVPVWATLVLRLLAERKEVRERLS